MHFSRAALAAIAASPALSQLVRPSVHRGQVATHSQPEHLGWGPRYGANVEARAERLLPSFGSQKPLGTLPSTAFATPGSFTVREQKEDICKAGSRQWTGWIDVSPEKSLFYWFFESRDDPQNDPVTVWINGGPGGSSMMGLFAEIGPCLMEKEGSETVRNEHSWTNFANVLFIDQPAGVGFSRMKNSTLGGPDNELEAARDFDRFLSIFFADAFPQYAHNPFHIAGESFGGRYVPGFVDYTTKQQQRGVPGTMSNKIDSIILVDAVLDMTSSGSVGLYDHMCRFNEDGSNAVRTGFNQTVCEQIEKAVPECEKLQKMCLDSYDSNLCKYASGFCGFYIDDMLEPADYGGRFLYDDRIVCNGKQPLCNMTHSDWYLNSERVQKALGLESHWSFSSINYDLNGRWEASGDMFVPNVREATYILDETSTRILVLNGNNDIVVNTEGQKRVYDSLPWTHQAKYRMTKFKDWFWSDGANGNKMKKGGEFKAVEDKLAFVAVDNAGHTSPGDQKEAVGFVVKCWLGKAGKEDGCLF
ncbi:Alpha/Beta hydrolase protein [Microdochium bolleyi]|uniref:Alpha/Beta hydrolase protein n=1 Tax=Microdochium bolleyi TaxID=196109 RepID=A0A136J2Q7_9PEZI|nr:Alpha/Beta hydrolase protein [Microdochium bolleyi]